MEIQNVGGETAVVDTPLVVFFLVFPLFFGGCCLNYICITPSLDSSCEAAGFLDRIFFFYGLIRHTISFRSWQGSASDWRQAVGSTSTMGFPPGARRLELTKKTTPGGTRGLEPTKNWVRNIDVQGGPAFQVQAINFFGGFLVYCFYSSLYFTLPVSWRSDGKSSSWRCISKKRWISTAIS